MSQISYKKEIYKVHVNTNLLSQAKINTQQQQQRPQSLTKNQTLLKKLKMKIQISINIFFLQLITKYLNI